MFLDETSICRSETGFNFRSSIVAEKNATNRICEKSLEVISIGCKVQQDES
jgi:hypothetical protein